MQRISLLTHLLEEIKEFRARLMDDAVSVTSDDLDVEVESESSSWPFDLVVAL